MPDDNNVLMEGVGIIFRNFTGAPDKWNKEGTRTFCVLIDTPTAERMEVDDWNIKWLDPREEGEERQAFLQVKLKYDGGRPPLVVMVTSRGRINLDESDVDQLDRVYITNVDLIVRPYAWTMPDGRGGVTAYLQSLYVTIEEDELMKKYGDLEEIKH